MISVVRAILKVLLIIGGFQALFVLLAAITDISVVVITWLPLFFAPFMLLFWIDRFLARSNIQSIAELINSVEVGKPVLITLVVVYLFAYFSLRYTHVFLHRSSLDLCAGETGLCTKHRIVTSSIYGATGMHEIATAPAILAAAFTPLTLVEGWYWQRQVVGDDAVIE